MNVMNCRALRQAQACFCVAFSLRSTSRRGGGSLCRVFRGAAGAVDNWVARQSRGSTLRFSSSSSSSFQAPAPPSTHGNPVFPDIDFSVAASPTAESVRRNNDPSSVFVVTGASRGIGLQFVKSLLDRTKVSVSLPVLVPGFVSLAHTCRMFHANLVASTRAASSLVVVPRKTRTASTNVRRCRCLPVASRQSNLIWKINCLWNGREPIFAIATTEWICS